MYSDPYGTTKWWEWLLFGLSIAVVGAAVVATVATGGLAAAAGGMAIVGSIGFFTDLLIQGTTRGFDNINIGELGLVTLGSSVMGGLAGLGMGAAAAGYGAGSFALAGDGSVSVGTAFAYGATLTLIGVLFDKGFGPRMGHNQHEKQIMDEALRRLKITDKDVRRRIHDKLKDYPYDDTLKKLMNIIIDICKRLGI